MFKFETPIVKRHVTGKLSYIAMTSNGKVEAKIIDGDLGVFITPIEINSIELFNLVSDVVESYLIEQRLIKGKVVDENKKENEK